MTENNEMIFKEERHAAILALLETEGKITTSLIQRRFGVSYGTARNDLDELAEKGLVQRTHSGALPVKPVCWRPGISALSSKERCAEVKENYLRIARAAVERIGVNEVVFVTSASIGYLMAGELPQDKSCTVVTNSLTIAEDLRGKSARVILTGGEMAENGNFYDDFTLSALSGLRFDKCFITSAALSAGFGLSIQGGRDIALTRQVIAGSRQVVGLYPVEKLGAESVIRIAPASALDVLITENEASDEECAAIAEQGVEIVRV